MAYRDELEAAQARVRSLEQDLEEARAEIERLEGKRSTALAKREAAALARPGEKSALRAWAGGPTRIQFEAEVEGEVPESAYQGLVEEMRRAVGGIGNVTTLGRSLAWTASPQDGTGRMVQVMIDARDGRTTIRVEERLATLAGGIYGGVLGGVGGGGTMLPILAGLAYPPLIPFTLAAWYGGIYALCRKLYGKKSRQREAEMGELLDALVALCEREIAVAEAGEETPANPE